MKVRDKELCDFIKKREALRLAKEAGRKKPWTKDAILEKYRFCNVRRNDDRVTRELRDLHYLWTLQHSDEDSWFWWVVARLFNKTFTVAVITPYITPFNPESMRRELKKLRDKGPIFNGAYIVSTNGMTMDKVDYVIDMILKPMWKDRERLRPSKGETLSSYHATLTQYRGMGSFMAAQVIADLKYEEPLCNAEDFLTWAASGPGSRRGLNRVLSRAPDSAWNEAKWFDYFKALWYMVNGRLKWKQALTGQDLQNCLCEFDKYERARLEEGTPKQLYKEKSDDSK